MDEFYIWKDDAAEWNLQLRRSLWEWEIHEVTELLIELESVKLKQVPDSITWKPDSKGCLTVRSFYETLIK